MASIHNPKMTNALIRCTRSDNKAHPFFELQSAELERDDQGLWVWDMIYPRNRVWNEDMEQLCNNIEENRDLLAGLKKGSDDFTLHLAVGAVGDFYPFTIPNRLASLSAECGFDIEIYVDN